MKICSNCNTYVEDEATFCSNCGALFFASEEEYNQYLQQQNMQAEVPDPTPAAAPKAKKSGGKKAVAIIAIVIAAVIALVTIIAVVAISLSGKGGEGGEGKPGFADQLAKFNPSKGLEFSSNGDGTCTLIGIGTCTDTTIVIPEKNGSETVTTIGEVDFPYDSTFTKVILADTITTVEDYAFRHCYSLEEVVLNEGLKFIGDSAFAGCEKLKTINFPSTIETIDKFAFSACTALTEVHLNEGLKNLNGWAFDECTGIQNLTIPSTIQNEINLNIDFNTTALTEINIPDSWKYFLLRTEEDYKTGKLRSNDFITTSLSYVEYPGFYYEISPENFALAITNMCNKKTLTVNGKLIDKSTLKPVGKFIVPDYYGAGEREFTEDGNVIYTWINPVVYENSLKDICTSPIVYNEEINMFTSTFNATIDGESVAFDSYFLNYGDCLLIINSTDILKDGEIYIDYNEYMKQFVGDVDLSGISADKLEEVEAMKTDLLAELIAEFNAAGISVTVNETTGEIAMDSSVLFGGDSSELTTEGAEFIDKFINVYSKVVFSEKYKDFVSKTLVEGHTAPTAGVSYEADLPLSEARANSVLNYCKTSGKSQYKSQISSSFEAVGYSNSKPIYDQSGAVDMDASRRVAFKLVLNIE